MFWVAYNLNTLSIYIHWPFCKSKCPYCDFNSHVREQIDQKQFLDAYLKEILYYKNLFQNAKINSIFFGGGTPTLAESWVIVSILEKLYTLFEFAEDIEITIEANPNSVEVEKFQDLKKAGINRVSIGIQSFNEKHLKFLRRNHSNLEAMKAVEAAAKVFKNYSFDLIYALPNQSLSEWEEELKYSLQHVKHHISLYQLTIEKGTNFYTEYKENKFQMPSDEQQLDFYNITQQITGEHNLLAYEISNHAKKGFECKHNLTYWNYRDYIAIGPGACGKFQENGNFVSTVNEYLPEKWQSLILANGNGQKSKTLLSATDLIKEKIMMGLRLVSGIKYELLEENKYYSELIDLGLLAKNGGMVACTTSGQVLLNGIISKLFTGIDMLKDL